MRAHLARPAMTTSQPNLSMPLQHANTFDAGHPDQASPSLNNSQRVQTTTSCPNLSQIDAQHSRIPNPSTVTRPNTMPSMSSPRFESLLVNSNNNPFNSNIHHTPIHRSATQNSLKSRQKTNRKNDQLAKIDPSPAPRLSKHNMSSTRGKAICITQDNNRGLKDMKKEAVTQKNTAQAPRATQGLVDNPPYNAQLLETVWPSDEHAAQRACFTQFLAFVQQQSLITPTEQTAFYQLHQQKWDLDFDAMGPLNTGEDEIGDQTLQDAINQSELMERSEFLLAIGRGEPDGETMLLLDMASLQAYSIDVNTSRVTDEIAITQEIGSTLSNN